MPNTGPVPKRSDHRIRRNKNEDGPTEKLQAIGTVVVPELGIPDCHPIVQDLYDSLKDSAQAKYYEPSDWQFARFTMHLASKQLNSGKPSAQMVTAINGNMTELLVSEGARRRVRLEVERSEDEGQVIDVAEMFRQRLSAVA